MVSETDKYIKLCTVDGFMVLCYFQQYFGYIVAVRFIYGGGNRRKPQICCKSLTNFIT
jgi:hypothetical protein